MSTSVPAIQWTNQGVVLPTDAAILAGVQTDIDTAFGGGVNPGLSTPQGQIASSNTAIISDKNSAIAYVVNQLDPQYSEGRFQDAIGRYYFMTRKAASSTVVIATIGGLPGKYIPAGVLALDTNQNVYQLLGAVTISSGGTIPAEFANVATGPIACAAGALSQLYQAVSGWDSVTNAAAGILGSNVESSQEFELRRQNSVALNSHGTTDAISANVYAVSGVLDCYVIDNPSGNTVNYGSTNYPLAPHSIYVAVVGGAAGAIAQAIWNAKDGGCNYNGNTTETVYDTRYAAPQPAYTLKFNIPTATPIYFAVTVTNVSTLPSNYATLIKNSIISQFNGENGSPPARIASSILALSYTGEILAAVPGLSLVSILVGLTATPTGYDVTMGIDQQPTLDVSNIAVNAI